MGALIAYRNDADQATLTATTVTGYPASNMQVRQVSERARFELASSQFDVDLGSAKKIRLLAMLGVNVNFTGANTTAVQYSTDGTTWAAVSATWPNDAPAAAKAGAARDVAPALYCVISAGITARYWRITCAWPRLDGAAFYEIGRLWLSDALVFPSGIDRDWSLTANDDGRLDFSAGLQAYEDARPRARVLTCSLSAFKATEAFGFAETATAASDTPSIQALQQEAGVTGEVIVLPRTSTPMWPRRLGVYGHLASVPVLRTLPGPNYECTLTVEEER